MTENEVIAKMKDGWDLRNRGEGYWLREPTAPYIRPRLIFVPDKIVENLERDKLIKLEVPYTSIVARLV